jgi:hypothetical protein
LSLARAVRTGAVAHGAEEWLVRRGKRSERPDGVHRLVVGLKRLVGGNCKPCTVDALPRQDAHRTHGLGLNLGNSVRLGPSGESSVMRGACTDTVEAIEIALGDGSGDERSKQLAHLVFGHGRNLVGC